MDKHADTVCKCAQPNRAKGSREELPCGVKGQSPLRSPEAEPLVPPPYLRTFSAPFCRALSAYMASSARCMMSRIDSSLCLVA